MAIRTVRLDDEAETALRQIREVTGLPISEALKRGLRSLRDQVREQGGRSAWDVYRELDLGPGGYAVASARRQKAAVREIIRKKHRR